MQMTTHELAQKLLSHKDCEVGISVDISTGQEDIHDRVYAVINHVQWDGLEAMIISEGDFNPDALKRYESLMTKK